MTATATIDWAELAPRAAVALLGEPDKREQGGKVWRWSGRGGLTLNVTGPYAGRFHLWSEVDATFGLLDIIRHETGADPMQWLADRGFIERRGQAHARGIVGDSGNTKPVQPKREDKPKPPSRNPAAEWSATEQIPADESHPARLWLSDWKIWRPGHPLPQGLRWQSAGESDRRHNPGGRRSGCRHAGGGQPGGPAGAAVGLGRSVARRAASCCPPSHRHRRGGPQGPGLRRMRHRQAHRRAKGGGSVRRRQPGGPPGAAQGRRGSEGLPCRGLALRRAGFMPSWAAWPAQRPTWCSTWPAAPFRR